MAIRMLVLITFHIQRKRLVLLFILGTSITDTNLNNSISINMHIGTNIHTTNSHIHIDFGSNTISHDHIDTKTSINNGASTNVHTNTGDLFLSYRPMTSAAVFSPKGSSWGGGGVSIYIYVYITKRYMPLYTRTYP